MTILQSKTSQQGDSDDPPPKKKLRKSKNSIRSQVQPHVVSHPVPSSAPGPSHRRAEQRDLYNYLPASSSYYVPPEPGPPQLFETGQVIEFQLEKFDVHIPPRSSPHRQSPDPFYADFDDAGPSHVVKTQKDNPDCLEYHVYRGWRSPNPKALKRPLPDVNLIEVVSSEDVVVCEPAPCDPLPVSDGISLLDDINNFDFDDKFGELEKFQQDAIWEDSKMHTVDKPYNEAVASPMNGYGKSLGSDSTFGSRLSSIRSSPAATLSNLGNTCFLNSVLYTLRFAPNFLHNLHHLVHDFDAPSTSEIVTKTASLGRNLSLIGKKKDKMFSLGAGDLTTSVMTKKQIVTDKLHGVYQAMRDAEARDRSDPMQPDTFLTALREVNPIFEGNQQQDAHELLVCLLDIFRETCQASARQAETRAAFEANAQSSKSLNKIVKKPLSQKLNHFFAPKNIKTMLERKNKKNAALNCSNPMLDRPDDSIATASQEVEMPVLEPPPPPCRTPVYNFVAQDFEGVMVLRTTCLECENTTEKNEPFADICVPIRTEYNEDNDDEAMSPGAAQNPSELYQRAVVTDEFLRERNKYYCDECKRYNEARRSVSYQRLPRLLTLQLKRFSSTFGAMSKVTKFMPTPMTLACFCEDCIAKKETGGARHGYELYGVIMHLGPTMAGGHYIAYVRMSDSSATYRKCAKDRPAVPTPDKPMFSLMKGGPDMPNGLTQQHRTACGALDCCAVRLPEPELHPSSKYEPESPWMECDDDNVKELSASEVETLLLKSSTSNATPYLLFYALRSD